MSVSLPVTSTTVSGNHRSQLVFNLAATGSQPCRNWFSTLPQLVFDLAATGFQPCRHWLLTLPPLILDLTETGDFAAILVTSVMESIRHNCEELVQEFEKSVKQDGRINL